MGKATISIPLITLRPDGLGGYRPRYIPGARHRKLGLKGEDLRHPDGTWFSLDECAAWSRARLELVEKLTASTPKVRRRVLADVKGRITVGELFERWFKSPRLTGVSLVEGKKHRRPLLPATVRFYRNAANQLEALDEGRVWQSPAAAISSAMISDPARGILHRIEVKHGLATARAMRAALIGAYAWGITARLVSHNPAAGMATTLPVPAPRLRVGSMAEMRHLVAAADAIGRADVGDAIVLGLWTGQRQQSRIELCDGQITADGILFRQGKKHGEPLLIPAAPELAKRLAAARERRRGWRVNYPHVVLDEVSKAPFKADWYRHVYAQVRKAATNGVLEDGTVPPKPLSPTLRVRYRLKPMASLAGFRDQDLRDTAVTWLAIAGSTKAEISSITGHSPKSIDDILKHYLGQHPDLARSAIGKLVAWYDSKESSE